MTYIKKFSADGREFLVTVQLNAQSSSRENFHIVSVFSDGEEEYFQQETTVRLQETVEKMIEEAEVWVYSDCSIRRAVSDDNENVLREMGFTKKD